MSKIWRDVNILNNYQKKIATGKFLHKASKEMIRILEELNILQHTPTVFELGCGSGRNLYYLFKANPEINIMGNDLVRKECFRYIEPSIRDKIVFHETPTETMVTKNVGQIDLLVVADHFMHLKPFSVQAVLKNIMTIWQPKHIYIRDTLTKRKGRVFKIVHDFSVLNSKYIMIHDSISKHSKNSKNKFFIKVFSKMIEENN